jgi:hypothetical protein
MWMRSETQLTGSIFARKVLRISMPHCLLFCLKRVGKLKKRSISLLITNIFLEYTSNMKLNPRIEHPISYYQKIFTKYFVGFYEYPMKDKIKGAANPRKFEVVTNKLFIDNIQRLAEHEAMSKREFVVKVL